MMCYYVPLRAGSRKNFNSPDHDFWCCTGTGVENHGKYGDSIYFHNQSQLYINQFIGSVLDWKEKGLQVRQETLFPPRGAKPADVPLLQFACARNQSPPSGVGSNGI